MRLAAIALLAATGVGHAQVLPSGAACPDVRPIQRTLGRDPCGFQCGIDRWSVKTLTDRDRDRIDFAVRPTTVAALGRLRPPARRDPARRSSIHERRVYCVEAYIIDARPQDDGDIHLSLIDAIDGRSEMIAEVPEPRCTGVCRSPYVEVFGRVRQQVERQLARWTSDTLRVILVGVGFFDRNHGQSGAAPNWFELHPILAIREP